MTYVQKGMECFYSSHDQKHFSLIHYFLYFNYCTLALESLTIAMKCANVDIANRTALRFLRFKQLCKDYCANEDRMFAFTDRRFSAVDAFSKFRETLATSAASFKTMLA